MSENISTMLFKLIYLHRKSFFGGRGGHNMLHNLIVKCVKQLILKKSIVECMKIQDIGNIVCLISVPFWKYQSKRGFILIEIF